MKKLISLLLALMLAIGAASALAATECFYAIMAILVFIRFTIDSNHHTRHGMLSLSIGDVVAFHPFRQTPELQKAA